MAGRHSGEVLRQLRLLYRGGAVAGLADGLLLERLASRHGESSEAAFEALVVRHGPMVLRVCNQVLRNPHDAEDAFQATFLVLARNARSIRRCDSVGPWLYGVACRVSARLKVEATRRRVVESRGIEEVGRGRVEGPTAMESWQELHEEVARLPDAFRKPVVLCYLQGLTYAEAADRLRWPIGTLKVRLARARALLRSRLIRRGLAPTVGLLGTTLDLKAAAVPLPEHLMATVRAGFRSANVSTAGGVVSQSVATLAEGMLRMMFISKLKLYGAVGLIVVSALGLIVHRAPASQESPPRVGTAQEPKNHQPGSPAGQGGTSSLVVAPEQLEAHAGHGTFVVMALDEQGKRIEEPGASPPGHKVVTHVTERNWAVIVGLVDHLQLRKNLAGAFGYDPSLFQPTYRRVEVERQQRGPDGPWSEWSPVDEEKNALVLDNILECTIESTPAEVRLAPLVDMLPYLEVGVWRGVDVEKFVMPPGKITQSAPRAKTTDAPEIMIRSLDFTVEPGQSYRYRARIVVEGPPARDRLREWCGPWSTSTAEVFVPKS